MKPFTVARLRLERAKAHGKSLADMWNAIPTEDFFRIRSRVEPDGSGKLFLTQVKPLPDEFALVLGEMLYQLRSALDSCIYQGAIYATKTDPPDKESSLEFPLTSDPDEFPKLAKRRLWAFSQDIQDEIERVQPYNTPTTLPPEQMVMNLNRSLGILNDLARKDRHRKLHVAGCWPMKLHPKFMFPPGVTLVSIEVMEPGLLNESNELAIFQIKGYRRGMAPIQVNPNLATTIGLNEPPLPVHQNDNWDPRFTQMIIAVNSVISAFEKYF
jgi:hypothetical protein